MLTRLVIPLAAVFLTGCPGDDEQTPLPCDVVQVFEDKCWLCHGSPVDFGAPVELVTWEDTQKKAPSDKTTPLWQMIDQRVHAAVRPMPPLGVSELAPDQLVVLEAWLAGGAPPAGDGAICQ